jgi:hypothetical protein
MVALKLVLRSFTGTKDWRLGFGRALKGGIGECILVGEADGTLRCYVNSDSAGCPDDYKSTNGHVIISEERSSGDREN